MPLQATINRHPFIRKVWILENASSLYKKNTGILLGDGRFELIFVHGEGYRTIRNNQSTNLSEGIYLGGQMDAPLDIVLFPKTHLTFVKVEPWVAGMLSGFHFRESLNETVPLQEINPSFYQKLKDFHPITQQEQILQVVNQSIEELSKSNTKWSFIHQCCTILDAEYADFKIAKARLLEELNCSARTIENKFAKSVGLSPQQYAIGIRFRKFTEELQHSGKIESLTALAYKHGFYDQAHLNRLFKQYWGFSPKEISDKAIFITNEKEPFRYYTI